MKTTFAVFVNQMVGEQKKAENIKDLLENKMNQRQKNFWTHVMFLNEDGETIQITREFLEEQGMLEHEIVQDWICHGDTEAEIIVLNPKGSGTINLRK